MLSEALSEAHKSEQSRLHTLHRYHIMDTAPEEAFDDVAKLAAQLCGVAVATICFVDAQRQWFKSCIGLGITEAQRTTSFCHYAIQSHQPFIVEDARLDPRFAHFPLVVDEPYLVFYAGVPLIARDGEVLGALEVMDTAPRQLSGLQLNALRVLAAQVMNQVEMAAILRKQEQVESTLRASEKRFAGLFSAAATGITLSLPRGTFVQANPAFCEMVGYSEDALRRLDELAITHADDREPYAVELEKLLAGESERFVLEKRYLQQNGAIAWARASVSCIHADDGESLYIICVTEDISERVNAQATASRLEEQLAMTLEHMTDAFCLLDHEWRMRYLNKVAEQLILHTSQQIQDLTLWDRFPPTTNSQLYSEFHRAVAEQTPAHFELFYAPLNNWFEVHAYPVPDGLAVYFRVITDRKQVLSDLRESEERFRQMAETIDDVFWIWNSHEDRILYVSPRYEVIFGQSREELYRDPRSFTRNIHPDDLERLRVAAAADRNSIKLDYRILLDNQEQRWVSVRTFPVYDADGNVRHSVGVAHDITQLMTTTEQLAASEQQYRLLFTDNPHPMWVYDLETLRFLAVNKQAVAKYGYSEEEFLAMTVLDIRPRAEVSRVLQAITTLQPHHEHATWRHRRKDGALRDVEILSDEIVFDGRKARLVLVHDVTEQLLAAEQMRRQAALLDKVPDAILVYDLNQRITYWNQGAEKMYGWRADEVIGKSPRDLLYRDPSAFDRAVLQLMRDGEWFGELQQIDRQGRDLLAEVRWALVRNDAGVIDSVFAIKTDITERKKLEMQFMRAQRMESIGTLAGGIAHDLNNVLAPILLSLGILKRQSRTPAEQKLLTTLENSAQRGADMVRQVLSFARGVEGERVVVDVGEVVRDLANLIRDTFDRSIRFQVNIAENLLPVLGDPTQIHQVVLNLCVNARDAMPAGGDLTITLSNTRLDSPFASMDLVAEPGPYVVLAVADTGVGIPADVRDRIFDPFFTTKEVGKGTGLGLPTVQAVVKSHGGFLNVYSEVGKGTEFKIYLPALANVVGDQSAAQAAQIAYSSGEWVLVIDDEPAIRLITQQTLESFGYYVLTAEGGKEALALYAKYGKDISIVLTDMMMPGMDGIALIQALRTIRPDVKVIAVSGLADVNTVARASSVGVDHFLQKPYTSESLLKVLAELHAASHNKERPA